MHLLHHYLSASSSSPSRCSPRAVKPPNRTGVRLHVTAGSPEITAGSPEVACHGWMRRVASRFKPRIVNFVTLVGAPFSPATELYQLLSLSLSPSISHAASLPLRYPSRFSHKQAENGICFSVFLFLISFLISHEILSFISSISLSILFPQQKPAASKLCSFPRSLSIFSHSNGRNGLWVFFRFYSH